MGSKERSGLQLKFLALICVFHFVFLHQIHSESTRKRDIFQSNDLCPTETFSCTLYNGQ